MVEEFSKTKKVPWNKDKKGIYSREQLKIMSETRKGKHFSPKTEFKKGQLAHNKGMKGWGAGEKNSFYGKKHTEESKQKMREAKKGLFSGTKHPLYGKHRSEETKLKISLAKKGSQSPNKGKILLPEQIEKMSKSRLKGISFEEALKKMNLTLMSEYKNNYTPVKLKCPDGHPFEKTPGLIRQGKGCPFCKQGIKERLCRAFFEEIFEKPFPKTKPNWLRNEKGNKMELDGYCEELKLAFEYHGEQHYEKDHFFIRKNGLNQRQRDDRLKLMQCINEHQVMLIELPYTTKPEEMEQVILRRCDILGVKAPPFRNIDYTKFNVYSPFMLNKAKDLAKAKGGECKSEVYTTARTKMIWNCNKYNHPDFEMTYDDVRSGSWCPKCGYKRSAQAKIKYSIPYFQKLVSNKYGGEILSTEYTNYSTKLHVKCKSSHDWYVTPSNLIKGTWCPNCKNKLVKENNTVHL
jgi:hypothetical protein